jgi:hypothetical protein
MLTVPNAKRCVVLATKMVVIEAGIVFRFTEFDPAATVVVTPITVCVVPAAVWPVVPTPEIQNTGNGSAMVVGLVTLTGSGSLVTSTGSGFGMLVITSPVST